MLIYMDGESSEQNRRLHILWIGETIVEYDIHIVLGVSIGDRLLQCHNCC